MPDQLKSLELLNVTFQFGQTKIALADFLVAIVVLLVGIAITRVLQRWLRNRALPRTQLDSSVQFSIVTIVGYVGIVLSAALALGRLGVALENIALVAGALSVGIGFGLQSIVSNFVSGLILLTEQPVRVGDWIVVEGEEGFVRRIQVRATEIETFDRATVLVPNSQLITGVVKNWTRANMLGRVTVPVGVSYSADPDKVRDLLLGAAVEHEQVARSPEPYVLFAGFGDSSLNFELRCIVLNIRQILTVKSDLHFSILRKLRAAGIEIPFPQRDIHIRSGTIVSSPVAESAASS
jgi:small-conductance mechanosensitive channel